MANWASTSSLRVTWGTGTTWISGIKEEAWFVLFSFFSQRVLNAIQIERVAAVNRNTIVVIHSVGPIPLGWNNHPNITAIVYAGAPGEQTGPSLVDVLWGAVNPSGRLPFSIADVSRDTSIVESGIES